MSAGIWRHSWPPSGQPALSRAHHPLSEREEEVLQLLALGHTNKEIAGRLGISIRTAETHRANVMQKLDLKTRAELVRYAIATGRLKTSAIAS